MKRTQKTTQFRQGDVLVERIRSIPKDVTPVEREAGRIVLAHGEATGHAHAIAAPHAALLAKGAERFLRVLEQPVSLDHEEHSRIELPAGLYRVVRQREYTPEEIRNVQD